jgi:hypothetical protein
MVDIVQNLRRLWDDLEGHLEPFFTVWRSSVVVDTQMFSVLNSDGWRCPKKYVWMAITGEMMHSCPPSSGFRIRSDNRGGLPVLINFHDDEEKWRKALDVVGSISNLCEFLDDEWHFVALHKDLCKMLFKRLKVLQETLIAYKIILSRFDNDVRFNPHLGYRRPSVERIHDVYNKLELTVKKLGDAFFYSLEDQFDAIEARLTATETN